MVTEHVIDLDNQRYADREYDGVLPASGAAAESARQGHRERALEQLRLRARTNTGPEVLDKLDLLNLLIVLGLDE